MVLLCFFLLLSALQTPRGFNIDTSKAWVSSVASPHLGHQVLQHSDGRQNWILTSSLGPGNRGELYKCHFQDGLHCEVASFGEKIEKLKNFQPAIAIAQSSEQILACLQQRRRQRRQATEELNGICVLLGPHFQEKAFVNLSDIIETKLSKSGHVRQRRSNDGDGFGGFHVNGWRPTTTGPCRSQDDAQVCKDGSSTFGSKVLGTNNNQNNHNNNYMEEEQKDEEKESYLRTEIAIVLDGSGSIEPEDFQQAKDFVYNMMKTFYEKCSECVFALVQYGLVIQTEFDLRDSKDVHTALRKVQAMRQVLNVTRTASAIQHVLDNIFSPSHGSQKNATKIMVVLTDGEIFLDTLKLETVIHSDRMAGIERYAIGVGAAFNKTRALQELRLIASDPHKRHLFRVANYSALSVLLSTLQEKIIGLEGTAGDILEFELAQSGFSVHFLEERYILFGAVGSFDWAGGVLLYDTASMTAVFLNETAEAMSGRNGYLGYSVDAIRTRHGTWIVAGAPRYGMTGKVLLFDREQGRLKQTLQGEQIGSYYGSEICPLDINQDGLTDHLLVGAPFFHIDGEEGKVYLYRWDQETIRFSLKSHLHGHPTSVFARFGFAVAAIGDINQDGFGDVAIGAPLEGQESNPSSCGSIYIFNGDPDGIRSSFSQRITAAQMHPSGLVYFGRSLAGGSDFTRDGLPDVVVGSLGNVTLLRSRLVIRLEPTMEFNPGKISNFQNSSIIITKLCFHRMNPQGSSQPGLHHLLIRYVVDLDVEMERKRAQFEDLTATAGEVPYAGNSCTELQLTILPCNEDCFSSILLRLSYQLRDPRANLTHPVPVLDVYQESERRFQLPYGDDCENKTVCAPRLKLTVHTEKELVVGITKELSMRIHLENTGDNSHRTMLLLEFPANLHFNTVQESLQVSSPWVECSDSQTLPLLSSSLTCKIGHPVFKTSAANFSVTWQLDGKKFPSNSANITLTVSAANRNSAVLKEEHVLRVKYALSYTLSSALPVIYISAREGLSQDTNFTFHINGKNRFGAQLQLQIWVPVFLDSCPLTGIKTVTGRQNATVCRIENVFSQNVDFGSTDPKIYAGIKFQRVSCILFSERENVTVIAELPLAHSVQVLKNRTDLVVRGELAYDKNLYVGPNSENHKAQIRVTLLKEQVFDYIPVVIGSSVSGFALLILMIFFLYKCGFFKRNYQHMREQEDSLKVDQAVGWKDRKSDESENLNGN